MKKNNSKEDIEKAVKEFFKNLEDKTAEGIKKIKKLSMSVNLKLGELRKNFCQKCYAPMIPGVTCEVRIEDKNKIVKCKICRHNNKWKLKPE